MSIDTLATTHLLALAAALGWASGLRLYAVVFFTGLAGAMGWVPLPAGLQLLQHPLVLGAAGLMLAVEFFADKVPGLDSLWDGLHTFLRIPAGAALAGAVFGGDQAAWATAAALLGGTLAATSHVAKATTRAAVNTSPEPFSNIGMSLAGDAVVPSVLWLSGTHPVLLSAKLAQNKTGVNIMILDACREAPFPLVSTRNPLRARAMPPGLAGANAPQGTLIAFSTGPGGIAMDGPAGSNSAYTRHLVTHLAEPGLAVEQLFKRIRIGVARDTQQKQIPWETSSLMGDFCFRPAADGSCPSPAVSAQPPNDIGALASRRF